jgi:cyanophycin synthetase
VVGCTSTDGVIVGKETIERGDWTGPAAARTVLRHPDVELAVLETARGGILRRGLAIDDCDVALITNVSDDHLGGYGIDDVTAMTRVKGVTAEAVRPGGVVVLNAHDRNLVDFAERVAGRVTFFADLERADAAAAGVVEAHRARGGDAVLARGGAVWCASGARESTLMRIADIPITFGGGARYNVENALGVVAAALGLGLDRGAIERGLRAFGVVDNPGRGQLVEKDGVRVMLDFGHNPEGVRAVMQLVSTLRTANPGKLTVVSGCAGDRSDREIEDVARAIMEARPDRVFVRELSHYMRGRAPGEVPGLFRTAFRGFGLAESAFEVVSSEVEALRRTFEDAVAGDFVALLVHLDHDEVRGFLGVER